MELVAHLKSLWPFTELEASHLAELAPYTRRRRYRAGDSLFHEGDPAHSLYLVLSGAVNLERAHPDGELCHLARFIPHDLVDEITLPNGKPRTADAVTVGPCELLIVDGAPFMRCLERSPRFAARYMEVIFERQRNRTQSQALFKTMTVVGRVAATLLELSEIYGMTEIAGARRVEVTVTQHEMARWVGVERESINRALSSLKRLGAIRVEGRRVVIIDGDGLRTYGCPTPTSMQSASNPRSVERHTRV